MQQSGLVYSTFSLSPRRSSIVVFSRNRGHQGAARTVFFMFRPSRTRFYIYGDSREKYPITKVTTL